MDAPEEPLPGSERLARCGRSAALAFWQAHAGQYLTQDLPRETGRCEACGLEDADLIRQPGQPPACAASYSLTRTYPKSSKAARNDQCASPTLAVVASGRALIVADGIELPGTGPGLFQVTGRKVDEFLADVIVRPPQPPSLVVSFGKIPAIDTRLRLNLDPRRLVVSGARQLDINLERLHLAEMAVAKVDIRELTRAMSVDHDRRHGVLMTEKELAFLDAFRAKWPAADPGRLPDKGTDTAAALLMVLRRLEATTNKFNLVGVTSLDGERLINTKDPPASD